MAKQQEPVGFDEPALIFGCCGAADVGAISDQATRRLAREGAGKQYCHAGIGGRVEPIMERTASAKQILAIDGCKFECVSNTLKQAGFTDFKHLCLPDLGFEKGQTDVNKENVTKVYESAKALLQD